MPVETEDAQAADHARDAQVVVVEARAPVSGGAGEVGPGEDLDRPGGVPGVRGGGEAVEVQHAG